MDSHDIDTLKLAVETILHPGALQSERHKAQQICDHFKETSPHCMQVGMMFSDREYPPLIRHFGLQLLEHSIKYKWNNMELKDREQLKQFSLQLIAEGTNGILKEELHIKDAISRLVVEIMKHDWPNYWTTLMADLYKLCVVGATQTELVLKVFLRIIEDVIVFQNIQYTRRREIVNAMNMNITEIFTLFVDLLEQHMKRIPNCSDSDECRQHTKVCVAALQTLEGYLDWVSMANITIKNNLLLEMLCQMLSFPDLQLPAAECMLAIVTKRGSVEERKPLLILFHEGAMATIWNAAVSAENLSRNPRFYVFLQKLCLILVELGKQLCFLLGSADVSVPATVDKYLEALLAFTGHPSQLLSSYAFHLWTAFLRHERMSKDETLYTKLPHLVEVSSKQLKKVGYPSQQNSPSCEYARLDFEHDEEFASFFSKYRAEIADTIRQLTMVTQKFTFSFVSQWLRTIIAKPVDTGEDPSAANCNLSSPSFLEWDSLTMFVEGVMSRLSLDDENQVHEGVDLLNLVLAFETQDPLILSCSLSCLSSLFIFLKYTPGVLPTVLKKIFAAVIFNLPGQTKSTRSKAVKNVRQHACSVLVKICKDYQTLMFPVFKDLCGCMQAIIQDQDQLSQMEECILTEALILVSNQHEDFAKQSTFLAEKLKPVHRFWSSEEFRQAFMYPDKLMHFIGLDQAPVEPSSEDTCGINRSHISYCTHMILAVIKRSTWPKDSEKASMGGFVFHKLESGEYVMKNPATRQIHGLLGNVLYLLKSMNMLFCEENLKLRHPEFAKAYDVLDNDIQSLMGIQPPCVDNTGNALCKHPLQRMQHFLTEGYDICCHILGNSAQYLGAEFYMIPCLAQTLCVTALAHLDVLTDYRLRSIIRVFLKAYVQYCPKEQYEIAVLPVLGHIFPLMYKRLSTKWSVINSQCEARMGTEDDNQAEQEVLEEHLARNCTREYMDLLTTACLRKKSESDDSAAEMEDIPPFKDTKEFSKLGKLCLASDATCEPLVLCVLLGLSWRDSQSCNKCMILVMPILKQLMADGKMTGPAAGHFLTSTLVGLHHNGQHEGTQANMISLCLQVYELLLPQYREVTNVLAGVPHCNLETLDIFEKNLLGQTATQKIQEKKKKETFKKLVSGIIGKHLSEQFKQPVEYKSLEAMFRRLKPLKPPRDEFAGHDMGLSALFTP